MSQWVETRKELPKDGICVYTKIDDGKSQRNFQYLMKRGNLWFFPDGSMYVYYAPTHWLKV